MEQHKNKTQMKTFVELLKSHTEFSKKAFSGGTSSGALIHLLDEVKELQVQAIEDEHRPTAAVGFEMADCFLLLFDLGMRIGFTPEQVQSFIEQKININKERKWQKNADGTYTHIK